MDGEVDGEVDGPLIPMVEGLLAQQVLAYPEYFHIISLNCEATSL